MRRLSLLVVMALVTGCAAEVGGQAVPDWRDVENYNVLRFNEQLGLLTSATAAMNPFYGGGIDATGIFYRHAVFGDRDIGMQSVVTVVGSPPSVLVQETDMDPGYTLDQLHIAGDVVDFWLLGEAYSSLAPTPWVQVPTFYGVPDEDPLVSGFRDVCQIRGFTVLCEVQLAVLDTARSPQGPEMRVLVQQGADGVVHSQTEVTLASIVAHETLFYFPDDIVGQFTPEMLETFVPMNLWQAPNGQLIKMELAGTVPGAGGAPDLVLQTGFELTGTATEADIPERPLVWDVTVITEDQMDDFLARMWEL